MRYEPDSSSAFVYPANNELQSVQSALSHVSQAINRSHSLTRAGLSRHSYMPPYPPTVGVFPAEHMATQSHEESACKSLLH